MKRSLTLAEKINAHFIPDQDLLEANQLIVGSRSPHRFDSPREFANHLVEGSLLNISVIGSRALSVPCGEYMVWLTDAGHTMLVPTAARTGSNEVFENTQDHYEVQTRDLMANWNRIERVFSEDSQKMGENHQNNEENLQEPEEGDPEEGQADEFVSKVDDSTVDRTPILRAMEDLGYTVTSLADEVGVDPPAISRILRTPKDVQGDPGGRNPSMGLAAQICNALRIDPTAAFPDIFTTDKYEARQTPGNTGSGDHGHHGKGAVTERLSESIETLEAIQSYETLCETIENANIPFDIFWKQVFWPSVRRIRANTGLLEFIDTMSHINNELITEGVGQWLGNATRNLFGAPKPQTGQINPETRKANPTPPQRKPSRNSADIRDKFYDQAEAAFDQNTKLNDAAAKMNSKILPKIREAFTTAMGTLKQQLQNTQMELDPKIAPHAWEIVNRFYNTVLQAGNNYTPQWVKTTKGQTPRYQTAYDAAKTEFNKTQGAATQGAAAPAAQSDTTN